MIFVFIILVLQYCTSYIFEWKTNLLKNITRVKADSSDDFELNC